MSHTPALSERMESKGVFLFLSSKEKREKHTTKGKSKESKRQKAFSSLAFFPLVLRAALNPPSYSSPLIFLDLLTEFKHIIKSRKRKQQ
jgi:hypothetical protein